MHFLKTTLHFALLSILGGSKTVYAGQVNPELNQDAFGITSYGFQCFDRVYPKSAIYAAAKQFCDVYEKLPDIRLRAPKEIGYRNTFNYGTMGDVIDQFQNSVIPILEDGTLYPYDLKPESRLVRSLAGQMVEIDPGPDRLLLDSECDVIGAFSDIEYTTYTEVPRVKNCRVLNSVQDFFRPSVRSPSHRSREPSPERTREQSLEISRERSRGRSRGRSPEISPEVPRELSPERSLQNKNPTADVFP
ncbi:hypothetical protein EPUL_005917, partial [Erysiphe pulchra]